MLCFLEILKYIVGIHDIYCYKISKDYRTFGCPIHYGTIQVTQQPVQLTLPSFNPSLITVIRCFFWPNYRAEPRMFQMEKRYHPVRMSEYDFVRRHPRGWCKQLYLHVCICICMHASRVRSFIRNPRYRQFLARTSGHEQAFRVYAWPAKNDDSHK